MESRPHNHTYMSRQNLADIASYAKKTLNSLERGAGELPQWVNHLISATRVHMKDVGHYMREQVRLGKRFGSAFMHRGDDGRRYAGHAPPAYMARKNLREIAEYADEAMNSMKTDAGIFPAWVEHKLSLAAQNMDTVGHFLENEGEEGRKYGSKFQSRKGFIPHVGDAGDIAFYRGIADGMGGQNRPQQWGESFQLKIYEQGLRQGTALKSKPESEKKRAHYYGLADAIEGNYNERWSKTPFQDIYDAAWEEILEGRRYGARGGGAARGGPRAPAGRGGGGRGAARSGAPAMGGRGRHFRRHKHRHMFPAWGYPYHPWWGHLGYYPAPIYVHEEVSGPQITHVYANRVERELLPEIPDAHAIIGMKGSGFESVPNLMVIRYRIGDGEWRQDVAPIIDRDDGGLEIALPISDKVLGDFYLGDIGFEVDGNIISIPSFFNALPRPWQPFKGKRYGANCINRDRPSMRGGQRLYANTKRGKRFSKKKRAKRRNGRGRAYGTEANALAGEITAKQAKEIYDFERGAERLSREGKDGEFLGLMYRFMKGSGGKLSQVGDEWARERAKSGPQYDPRSYAQTRPIPGSTAEPMPIPAYQTEFFPSQPALPPGIHAIPGQPPEMTEFFAVPSTLGPLMPSKMMQTHPPSRMLEDHRQGLWSRMQQQPTGRRFGVPDHPYGTPGWAGQGGVAQRPLAAIRSGGGGGPIAVQTYGSLGYGSMGDGSMDAAIRGERRYASNRKFGPGLNAGQGGVQILGAGRGPIGIQTYGSLGYGSLGIGSMDRAIQGGKRRRRYAGSGSKKTKRHMKRTRKTRRGRR